VPSRPPRSGVALLLGGVLILFVGVIAQLAVTDGLAETIWVCVSIVGAFVIVAGIAVLVRHSAATRPPED
jgi:hypothetical protein